jgi:hypothetical protein
MPSAEQIVAQLADAKGEVTLSLQRVLRGFVAEVNGEEAMGKILGQIVMDDDVPVASKINLMNNVLKLMGQYGEADNQSELLNDEQVLLRLKALDQQICQQEPSDQK